MNRVTKNNFFRELLVGVKQEKAFSENGFKMIVLVIFSQ